MGEGLGGRRLAAQLCKEGEFSWDGAKKSMPGKEGTIKDQAGKPSHSLRDCRERPRTVGKVEGSGGYNLMGDSSHFSCSFSLLVPLS